jgi:hypothetical protein
MEYYEIPGVSNDQVEILRKLHYRIKEETSSQHRAVAHRVLVDIARRAIKDGITDNDAFEERLEEGLKELENIRLGLIGNLHHGSIAANSKQIPELKRLFDNMSEYQQLDDSLKDGDKTEVTNESDEDDELSIYPKEERQLKALLDRHAFFCDFDPLMFKASELHFSPVDFDSLTNATKHYFERPWLQSSMLDWFLINGFLRSHLDGYLEGLYTGSLFGDTSWRRIFFRNKKLEYFTATVAYWLFCLVVDWLLLPGLALVALYFGYEYVALGLLVIFGVILFLRILYIPTFIKKIRTKRKLIKGAQELWSLKVYASNKMWSPSTMIDRIEDFERNFPELPIPPLRSLLSLAIRLGREIAI